MAKTIEEYLAEIDRLIGLLSKLRGWDAPTVKALKKDIKDCIKEYDKVKPT